MNMDLSSQRLTVRRPAHYPFLESMSGPPVPYTSTRHLHEELEISFNPGRSWQCFCRGKTLQVSPDMVLLTPPEEVHRASSPEIGGGPYSGLRIHPDGLRMTLSEICERPQAMLLFSDLLIRRPSLSFHLLSLHHALQDGECSRLEQDTHFHQFVLALLPLASERFDVPAIGLEPGAIQTAKAYIQENMPLHSLAQLVHLSPFYFSRVFQARVGLPPHAYLTQVRISPAKTFLASGIPPAEVAVRTGFSSQSHLNRHFKSKSRRDAVERILLTHIR